MSTTQPIRDEKNIIAIMDFYYQQRQYRNYLLINMGIYTALRISDLLSLIWDDIYDFEKRRFRKTITITEEKTGKSKIVALNKDVIKALQIYKNAASIKIYDRGRFLFENKRTGKAISRVQGYRIIRAASDALKFDERVSCHSLRKTFGYHAWKSGVSPAVIMEIYNHSSLAVTRRYLGITQDDKNAVYLNLKFSA